MRFLEGVIVGGLIVLFLLTRNIRKYHDWVIQVALAGERGKIKAGLKQGLTIDQIVERCKHHDRDDVLNIKNEMWNEGEFNP